MSESTASVTSRFPSTAHLLPRVLFCFLALLPLYLLIQRYDQIFHAVLEVAIITVGVAIFSVGWNACSLCRNDSLLVVAVGFLCVASFDLLHTLSYQGFLPGSGPNLSNQLWAASGLMEGLSLLMAAALGKESIRLRPFPVLFAWLMVGGLLTAAITPLGLVPDFYRPEDGHTLFNAAVKGFNLLLLLAAAWLFGRRRGQFPPYTALLLIMAAAMQLISEASLFLRLDVAAFPGFFGHLTRFFGHILVFAAMIQGSLLAPYAGLVRNLSASERRLRGALSEAETNRDNIDVILRSVNDGLIVADMQNRVVLMNTAAENLLGIRGSEAFLRPVSAVLPLEEQLSKSLEGDCALSEFPIRGPDPRRQRIIQARTSPVRDKGGEHSGTVTIFQDVTREREIDRMKSEFISTAAHELRTPLTSIQGFSEILLRRGDIGSDEQETFLHFIHDQSEVLTRIVQDLLDIARIESGGALVLNRTVCPVKECLRQIEPLLQTADSRHRFVVDLQDADTPVRLDKVKIQQVLENLLSNAIKYSPQGGEIRILGALAGDRYRVSVSDQGIGMTPEQVSRIFDKFYRADASNAAVTGVGLGMNIVRSIVEAHGESIWVESEPGRGTTVTFTLAVARRDG